MDLHIHKRPHLRGQAVRIEHQHRLIALQHNPAGGERNPIGVESPFDNRIVAIDGRMFGAEAQSNPNISPRVNCG